MKTTKILSVFALVALLTACGSQTSRTSVGASTASGSNSTSGLGSTSTGNIYNLPLAPQQNVKVSGSNGPYPTVMLSPLSTSHTLKVKVTALNAPNMTIPGYEGWVFPYGCMQLTVTVNGVSQTTQVLRVGNATQGSTSACANAPTAQTLDFTNAITGNSAVSVTLSNPQYDNCRYYWPMNYGCSMSAVWSNHLVAATIATQIDGTWMDP